MLAQVPEHRRIGERAQPVSMQEMQYRATARRAVAAAQREAGGGVVRPALELHDSVYAAAARAAVAEFELWGRSVWRAAGGARARRIVGAGCESLPRKTSRGCARPASVGDAEALAEPAAEAEQGRGVVF